MRWICLWCLLSVLASTALHAQIAPAWTRQLNPSRWHEISRSVVTTPVQSSLVRLSRQVTTASLIKTNDQNWLRHKVFYSGLFSRQEKDLLLTPAYPKATLGKIIYLYDKHTSFLAQLTTTGNTWHVNPKAFQQHQKILQNLAISLQKYYIEQTPTDFTSIVFSQKEIQLTNLPRMCSARRN